MSHQITLTYERSTKNYALYSTPLGPGRKWMIYLPKYAGNAFKTWVGAAPSYAATPFVARPARIVCSVPECGCKGPKPKPRRTVRPTKRKK